MIHNPLLSFGHFIFRTPIKIYTNYCLHLYFCRFNVLSNVVFCIEFHLITGAADSHHRVITAYIHIQDLIIKLPLSSKILIHAPRNPDAVYHFYLLTMIKRTDNIQSCHIFLSSVSEPMKLFQNIILKILYFRANSSHFP